jgi:hypothetical protein
VNPIRPLYLSAAVLTVTGVALRLAPVGHPSLDTPPSAAVRQGDGNRATPVESAAGALTPTATDPIVTANIFARERTAPSRASTALIPTTKPHVTTPPAPRFILAGTTSGPQGAVALINGGVHRIGDTIDGATLTAITDSTATLNGKTGTVVLRLPAVKRSGP